MDKKQAELDTMKKAKDAQHAAGKNTGMSGRDLVCSYFLIKLFVFETKWSAQFTYNPDWAMDDDEDEDEDWDIQKYRKEQEEANEAAEEARIQALNDGYREASPGQSDSDNGDDGNVDEENDKGGDTWMYEIHE